MPVRQLVPDYSHIAAQGEIWGDTVSQLGDLAADTFYKYQGIKRDENETNQLRSMIKQTFMDPQNMEMYGLEKSEAKALVSKLQNMDKPELTQVLQNFRIYDTLGAKEKIGMPNPFAPTDVFKKAIEIEINRKHGADVSQAAKMAAQGGAVQYPGGQLGAPGEPPPQTTMQGPPAPTGPAGSESQFLDRFSQLAPEGATAKEALGTPAGAAFGSRMKEQKAALNEERQRHQMRMQDIRTNTANLNAAIEAKQTSKIDEMKLSQISDDYRSYYKLYKDAEEAYEQAKENFGNQKPTHPIVAQKKSDMEEMKEVVAGFEKAMEKLGPSRQKEIQEGFQKAAKKKEEAAERALKEQGVTKFPGYTASKMLSQISSSPQKVFDPEQGVDVPIPGTAESEASYTGPLQDLYDVAGGKTPTSAIQPTAATLSREEIESMIRQDPQAWAEYQQLSEQEKEQALQMVMIR